jgi:DNA-binding NarL/FixJ family response regulator
MVDPVSQLNRLFGERYSFQREIGRGRIGIVFSAEDLKYGRTVAVKSLWAREVGKRAAHQFLREIEIAARLSHPNILPVLDSGERDGVAFFAMPLAEGGSLRERLDRTGPLPVPDAVRMASELLEALRYSHSHGVVHLDVKPENILLCQDHALLADFGVARVACAGDPGWKAEEGPAGGSVLYICPSHASRRSSHDPRSDLYSLACVLYELLSGEPPFRGPSLAAILHKHRNEPPFPLTTRSTVSPELDRVVRTALEKEPADRFQDAGAFLGALQEAAPRPSFRAPAAGGGSERRGGDATGTATPITVWIVEDSADTRSDVRALVQRAEGMSCPLAFESGEDCLAALQCHWAPDVVIMDIGLPGMSGIEATAHLKRSWPGTEVVMFTVHEDFDRLFQAFQAGAISYLDKTASDGEILRAIREAGHRGCVMTPPIARRFLSLFTQLRNQVTAYQLSAEDVDLLSGLTEGKGMDEIGLRLGLGPEALEARLSLVHAKLHANQGFSPR